MRMIFMGPPGAGKGTQAKFVAERFTVPAISTGDIFRANVSKGTELGVEAQRFMDAGEYVPDEVTNRMVRNRIDEDDALKGFLLDGYPRTLAQVEELDGMIGFTGHSLDAVVVLTVDPEELVQRLVRRAETDGRSDDTEDVIRRRQEVYAEQTEPLIGVYRDRDLLIEVDGMGEVSEVTQRIIEALSSVTESERGPRVGLRDRGVEVKTPDQVQAMRVAGLLTGRTLDLLRAAVRPGVTTARLDSLAEEHIRDHGGVPSFLGYGTPPFPGSICASVNDEVVHGVPGARELVEGDVVSIDCGAIVDGWHGDAAVTVPVGEVAPRVLRMIAVAEEAMWAGIAAAEPGGRVSDISRAVETTVRAGGDYGILRHFTGHGIGTAMHQAPDVPNYGQSVRTRLRPGIALAVEPMLTLGSSEWEVEDDDWTIVTDDGSWAAHVEHTFALTEDGPWVLTAEDGGRAGLARARESATR